MRTRILLGTVITATMLFSHVLFGKKTVASAELSVKQKFHSEISNLEKNLLLAKKQEDKWKALAATEARIQALRSKNALQNENDESYMDLSVASLQVIPRGKAFKKKDCDEYRTSILARFDPQENEPESGPIKKTLGILQALCK